MGAEIHKGVAREKLHTASRIKYKWKATINETSSVTSSTHDCSCSVEGRSEVEVGVEVK